MSIITTGNTQYLDTSTNTPVLNGEWSYCFWLGVASFTGGSTVLVTGDIPGATIYHRFFVTNAGTPRIQSPDGGTTNTVGGGNMSTNVWEWFGVTHSEGSTTTKVYRASASLVVTLENTITESYAGTGNYLILYQQEDIANRLRGEIIAYKEWSDVLSQAQMENEARQMYPRRTLSINRFLPTLNNAEGGRDYSGLGHSLTKHGTFLQVHTMPPVPFSCTQPMRLR